VRKYMHLPVRCNLAVKRVHTHMRARMYIHIDIDQPLKRAATSLPVDLSSKILVVGRQTRGRLSCIVIISLITSHHNVFVCEIYPLENQGPSIFWSAHTTALPLQA
jgi:hypothetical protein